MGVVVAAVVTFALLMAVGWAVSRVMSFEVKQLKRMRGFSRFVAYEDEDHPREE